MSIIESAASTIEPTLNEMEALFINNADLGKLKSYLNRFNPIRVMKAADKELKHSTILGWLLSLYENHGFGDNFLRSFLGEALRNTDTLKPSALDVVHANLRDVKYV